jgi:hypothetical protein
LLAQLNPAIVFLGDTHMPFNIRQDYPQLIALANNQTTAIALDSNYSYSVEVWDIIHFFLHASFRESKYNYLCENNDSYHKLVKQYSLLRDSFDVWFSIMA